MATEVDTVSQHSFWDFKSTFPFVDEWFLMGSPYPVAFILTTYLFFVLHCGKKFMEHRPAYELRNVLLVYNAFQVIFSVYIFFKGVQGIYDYGIFEKGCFIENGKTAHRLLSGHHLYFMAKLSELLDTVFFVLRKKWNQVTFLHVYHHSLMFFFTWIIMKKEPTYSLLFTGVLNSFVHIIMYTYYGLSAFPELSEYLWWKKYITKLQLLACSFIEVVLILDWIHLSCWKFWFLCFLVLLCWTRHKYIECSSCPDSRACCKSQQKGYSRAQFTIIIIHITWTWCMSTCPASYILMTLIWTHLVFFTYLFTDFYYQAYKQKKETLNEKVQ